jgi:hypothetical protein
MAHVGDAALRVGGERGGVPGFWHLPHSAAASSAFTSLRMR